MKLPLTQGIFALIYNIFANTLFHFTVYRHYRDLNNKLNRKYVEKIIISEYHVFFSRFCLSLLRRRVCIKMMSYTKTATTI